VFKILYKKMGANSSNPAQKNKSVQLNSAAVHQSTLNKHSPTIVSCDKELVEQQTDYAEIKVPSSCFDWKESEV